MTDSERIYEAFGELAYAVAIADGYIQPEETVALKQLLSRYDWADAVQWSFDYEVRTEHSVQHAYNKALDTFAEVGPRPEYPFFVEVLEQIAQASQGKHHIEARVIDGFQKELRARFIADLDRLKLMLSIE